jgi:signal transduction histidine kinase
MPFTGVLSSDNKSRLAIVAGRFARRLVPLIYGVSALAFLADLERANTLAYGIIYTPLIATAVFHRRRSGVWVLTTLACVLVIVGGCFPVVDADLPDMIGNRLLSVIAILATAAFVHHARDVQERLAVQTRRAAAAERMKTDVLEDLSAEIRTPLHTLLGVLTLTMATSKPDQREALGRVRSDGKQLLATIDNLIDLSQTDARTLQRQKVDIALIARYAVNSAGSTAAERQITITVTADGGVAETSAIGDPWAIRRILDNLLANAVRLTPPGGTVMVRVTRNGSTVIASVSDTGGGLPVEMMLDFHEDSPETDGSALQAMGGTGLALSSQLARTMGGRITARNQALGGAAVSLSLPAA